ncbi:MAG: hypothetical protein ACR2P0_18735 [Acidimicrobiales bacterium]
MNTIVNTDANAIDRSNLIAKVATIGAALLLAGTVLLVIVQS